MAKEHSMDISIQFDFQELKNAVEQAKKEATNRYDLKDSNVEIELSQDHITITTQSDMQIDSVFTILLQKVIGRSLSPKILDRQDIKAIGGMRSQQQIKLIDQIDQENAKKISKIIRENFPKAKPVIQGETIRVSAKSIDDLQAIIKQLQNHPQLELPLNFGNYK